MEVEQISINKCKVTLEKDGSGYTNEEVSQIRDFLYMLAELEHKMFFKMKNKESEIQKNNA